MEGGIPQGIAERWGEYTIYSGPTSGPVNHYKRNINKVGGQDISIDNIIDDKGELRQIDEWPGVVRDGIRRARQLTWQRAAKNRPHHKGMENVMDKNTTRTYYITLAQKNKHMDAGALHTMLADGVWTPERADKRRKNADGLC
eukprot:2460149-Heterocapsa_arctica.AAC.1